jgi:hypothetical protein
MRGCGNPDCNVSTGICERITFGSGNLDELGYWEKPCFKCAELWKREHPTDEVWPNIDPEISEPKTEG